MMKLHQQLESVLKVRVNSNDEIIAAIKRLSEMGKLDKPKELAMFAVILDRLGKMEDEKLVEESVKESNINTTIESIGQDAAGFGSENNIVTEPVEEVPTITEFSPENITDPKPQVTEPQAT